MIKRNPIGQPLFLAALLAVGFSIAWGVAVFWCVAVAQQFVQAGGIRRDTIVLADGTPVVQSYSIRNFPDITLETLEGKPLPPITRQGTMRGTSLPIPHSRRPLWLGLDWQQRVRSFTDADVRPLVYWHLIHDGESDGGAYFVGYDCRNKLCVGYMGRSGFQRHKPAGDECFQTNGPPGSFFRGGLVNGRSYHWRDDEDPSGADDAGRMPHWVVDMICGDQLLEVDLHNRSVRVLLEEPGLQSVGAVQPAASKQFQQKTSPPREDLLAVRTESEVLILDSGGTLRRRYVIPDVLKAESFDFFELGESGAMANVNRYLYRAAAREDRFVWFDNEGEVQSDKSVHLPMSGSLDHTQAMAYLMDVGAPVPALVTPMVLFVLPLSYVESRESPDYPSAMGAVVSDTWPALVAVNLLGVALAWVCYRRQRQCGQGWTWAWVGFVFLFGLPGLIGYLFHRGWPARQPCPSCSQPAPRDRESCFECWEEFPQPAPKGIEVLVT